MLMPVSGEFVALCQSQIGLITRSLGAASTVVYLREQLLESAEAKLIPVAAYPEHWGSPVALPQGLLAAESELWREEFSDVAEEPAGDAEAIDSPENKAGLLPGDGGEVPPEPLVTLEPSPSAGLSRRVAVEESAADWATSERPRAVLPLLHEGIVVGVLVTERAEQPWSLPETTQLEEIAHTLAIAFVMDQRGQWLQQQWQRKQLNQAQQSETFHDLLHQFRNPLTALRTFGKLLLKRIQPGDVNQSAAAGIVRESERLEGLLQQFDQTVAAGDQWDEPGAEARLLALPGGLAGKAGAETAGLLGTLQLTPCDLVAVLGPLVATAAAVAQERGIDLRSDLVPGSAVQADERALREVLSNLIDNALKYAPRGSRVWVATGLSRPGWQGVMVADDGPGIPAADLERVFERHYRGVQAATAIPGTGLGLAIARQLVQGMGGEIYCFSPAASSGLVPELVEGDGGTVFVVWLAVSC